MKLFELTILIYIGLLILIDLIRLVILYRRFKKEIREREKDVR